MLCSGGYVGGDQIYSYMSPDTKKEGYGKVTNPDIQQLNELLYAHESDAQKTLNDVYHNGDKHYGQTNSSYRMQSPADFPNNSLKQRNTSLRKMFLIRDFQPMFIGKRVYLANKRKVNSFSKVRRVDTHGQSPWHSALSGY
jgi:hypothetical protein